MTAKNSEFLTSSEAAKLLGVALSTVQLWTESGLLRAWKTGGGHRRITRRSVDYLLNQQHAAVDESPSDDRVTAVVVEDDEGLLKLYQAQFAARELPIQLVCARDGFEGLIQIGRYLPDVVITDLMMPGMDGFQMIKALKGMPELKKCLILVVSALTEEEIRARGTPVTGLRLFQKPIPFDVLEVIVREHIDAIPVSASGKK